MIRLLTLTRANERAAAIPATQRAKWADRPPVNTLTRQQLRRIARDEAKAARADVARVEIQARRHRAPSRSLASGRTA